MGKNKVKFNIKNVHWAKVELSSDNAPRFGPWNAWPGSVSISLEAQGDITSFYADGIVYYKSAANNGYEGDFESALVPERFRMDILGEVMDDKGVLVEKASAKAKSFALAYEIDTDEKGRRNLLYYCSVTRPGMAANTVQDKIEPETDKIKISATPLPGSELIKAYTSGQTDPDTYEGWYEEVYYSPVLKPSASLSTLTFDNVTLATEFDPSVTAYTAIAESGASTLLAETVSEDAEVEIMMGSVAIENGGLISWSDGLNTVTITVTAGPTTKVYAVKVTKKPADNTADTAVAGQAKVS